MSQDNFPIDSTMLYGSFNKDGPVIREKDHIDLSESNFNTFGEMEGKSKVTAVSEL